MPRSTCHKCSFDGSGNVHLGQVGENEGQAVCSSLRSPDHSVWKTPGRSTR